MNRAVIEAYYLAKEAQDERFERAVQGRDRTETGTPEYREYYGLGEYAGGGVERRVTFRDFLTHQERNSDASDCDQERRPVDDTDAASVEGDPEYRDTENTPQIPAVQAGMGFPWVSPEACRALWRQDLEALAADGDGNAATELARRAQRRAAKRATRELVPA